MTEQKSGRLSHIPPGIVDFPSDRLNFLLPKVILKCLNPESAQRVANEFPNRDRGGPTNTMKVDGDAIVITYADKRWPYRIAEWADEAGLVSDSDSARVFACL